MRADASVTAARIKLLKDGAQLEIIGEDRQADGRTWRNVRDPSDGAAGWIAAELVTPVDAVAPAGPAPVAKPAAPIEAAPFQPTAISKAIVPASSGGIVCNDGYHWPGTTRQGACSQHGEIAPGY
jgi:hypothetical protein